ncbi:MAG: protein kinase domain-containing protein [Spirulinaceae cyanobacterium]
MSSALRHCIAPHCPAPADQPAGHRFCQHCGSPLLLEGRYRARSRLGVGGFATIYTVWNEQSHQEQVLKVLTYEGEVALQLFRQEARVLGQLRHPGIPRVGPDSFFSVKTPQQQVYCLVMEKIQGDTLEQLQERDYPQGCPEALVRSWLEQVVEILALLHRHGILHRDIKPANLMRREDTGQIVLIDFGGAKQLDHRDRSTRLFSSGYSPPEQVVGQTVRPTVDIYALGRTLIHLLTGRYPGDMAETGQGRLVWQTAGVTVSDEFASLLNAMVAPDVRDRPSTAAAIQRRLGLPTAPGQQPWATLQQAQQTLQRWLQTQLQRYRQSPQPRQIQHQKQKIQQQIQHQISGLWHSQQQSLQRQINHQITQTVTPKIAPLQTAFHQRRRQITPYWQQTRQLVQQSIGYTVASGLTTLAQMLSSSIGAIAGTLLGAMIRHSAWGQQVVTAVLNPAIAQFLPGLGLQLTPAIWLITLAGMGTAGGLVLQSPHLTQRPVPIVTLLGGASHAVAWLVWLHLPGVIALRFTLWSLLTVGGLVLSLGLRRSLLTYLSLTMAGTTATLWGAIAATRLWPHLTAMLTLEDAILTYGLCAVLALLMALWLGLTHYALLPLAEWIRRRLEGV